MPRAALILPRQLEPGKKRPPASVLRWAGGKAHLLPHLTPLVPQSFRRYIEPMVGGAAVFFRLAPPRAILSDLSDELINFYRVLRDDPDHLITAMLRLKASKERYYRMRSKTVHGRLQRALRFVYLNRLAWNGLYRVNEQGAFNVPIGDRLPSRLWDRNHLHRAATILQAAELTTADFEVSLSEVRYGDFVFLDPPYPKGARGALGFNRYSPGRFGIEDHHRLAHCIERLMRRGASVMLTIDAASGLRSLYPDSLFDHSAISRSLIAGNGAQRRSVRELVLTSYKL